jgi:hypothetical protein
MISTQGPKTEENQGSRSSINARQSKKKERNVSGELTGYHSYRGRKGREKKNKAMHI